MTFDLTERVQQPKQDSPDLSLDFRSIIDMPTNTERTSAVSTDKVRSNAEDSKAEDPGRRGSLENSATTPAKKTLKELTELADDAAKAYKEGKTEDFLRIVLKDLKEKLKPFSDDSDVEGALLKRFEKQLKKSMGLGDAYSISVGAGLFRISYTKPNTSDGPTETLSFKRGDKGATQTIYFGLAGISEVQLSEGQAKQAFLDLVSTDKKKK